MTAPLTHWTIKIKVSALYLCLFCRNYKQQQMAPRRGAKQVNSTFKTRPNGGENYQIPAALRHSCRGGLWSVIHTSSEMLTQRLASCQNISHRNTRVHDSDTSTNFIQTHQDLTAVTKPATPVFSGQDEGERLTVKKTSQILFNHTWKTKPGETESDPFLQKR